MMASSNMAGGGFEAYGAGTSTAVHPFWNICQLRVSLALKAAFAIKLLAFIAIFAHLTDTANAQIAYIGHLSELRIHELRNIANHMEHSINPDKYACESYYDYVCSRHRPLFTVLGHLPNSSEIMNLFTELQMDTEQFEAKDKVHDFFISCSSLKDVDDCYRETFEYFKPLFGYTITKFHIDGSSHEHNDFLHLLDRFLKKTERTEDFIRHPIRIRLTNLKDKFRKPHVFFRPIDLNREYSDLRIYRESYEHNIRNLEQFRKLNLTYAAGTHRVMLDWSLYIYQSRNKPMSYFFPTFNVHLWMAFYNTTVRQYEPKRLRDIGECLKLPQYVNVLEEARILAVVYLKSFENAWQDYEDWITMSTLNREIFNQENEILNYHRLNNNHIFFTLFGQNFCDFGKELAEQIFYLGLRHNEKFFNVYSCGYQREQKTECL